MAEKKWMQNLKIKKGGLHRSLGIPEGKTIPYEQKVAASKKKGLVGKQARLALTFAKARH